MPIYEYLCNNCKELFEALRPIKDSDKQVCCPICNSINTKRKVSSFQAFSGDHRITQSSNCSGCSHSNCSTCGK